jgi:hypothetical protein
MSYLPSENSKSDNVKFKHSFLLHSNGAWIRLLDGASVSASRETPARLNRAGPGRTGSRNGAVDPLSQCRALYSTLEIARFMMSCSRHIAEASIPRGLRSPRDGIYPSIVRVLDHRELES